MNILLAIILGTVFGLILQRIGAADPDKIIGMLRLTDLHLAKTILLAIGISSSILFLGMLVGVINSGHLGVKSAYVGVIIGGAILGAGWALSGFCPGTGVVAVGTGRKDGIFFLLGGLIGAGIFTAMYGSIAKSFLFTSIGGTMTLAQTSKYDSMLSGVNGAVPAVIIGIVLIVIACVLPQKIR